MTPEDLIQRFHLAPLTRGKAACTAELIAVPGNFPLRPSARSTPPAPARPPGSAH